MKWKRFDSLTTCVEFLDKTNDAQMFAISAETFTVLENGRIINISSGMSWSDCTNPVGKGGIYFYIGLYFYTITALELGLILYSTYIINTIKSVALKGRMG